MKALLILLVLFVPCSLSSAAKPNLVFMIADDCTYLDMGVYGGQAKTPNLDKLAGEGMQFSRCFQTAPMCSPTRHNIYTGLYPVRSGAWPPFRTWRRHWRMQSRGRRERRTCGERKKSQHLQGPAPAPASAAFPGPEQKRRWAVQVVAAAAAAAAASFLAQSKKRSPH